MPTSFVNPPKFDHGRFQTSNFYVLTAIPSLPLNIWGMATTILQLAIYLAQSSTFEQMQFLPVLNSNQYSHAIKKI